MCRQTVFLRGQDYVLYIILEHVSFNIMFHIKSDVITLGGFGDIDCIYMDKWALYGHFYSYVDPVWLLYNIGTGCHENAQIVFWVELPYKGDSSRFLFNPESWENGTKWCGVGLPDIRESSAD